MQTIFRPLPRVPYFIRPAYIPRTSVTAYAISGATTGTLDQISAAITVTPNTTISSDTVTPSDGGAGGTFTPSSLTFTSSYAPQTVTYTPATTGALSLTFTSTDSYLVVGSPWAFQSFAGGSGPPGGPAFIVASNVPGAATYQQNIATGKSCQGHVIWAQNMAAWWVFYLYGTQQVAAVYSYNNGATWSTPQTFTLAQTHYNEGDNFSFCYANIDGIDIVYMNAYYTSNGAFGDQQYVSRFTLWTASGGPSFTNTNAEAQIGATLPGDGSAGFPSGSSLMLDSNNLPWLSVSCASGTPWFNSGGQTLFFANDADTGSSWSGGFANTSDYILNKDSTNISDVTATGMFSLGGGYNIALYKWLPYDGDNVMTNLGYITQNISSSSSGGPYGLVFASSLTQTDSEAWGAIVRTTSDIHALALNDNLQNYSHARYNGSAWATGDAVDPIAHLTYDFTSGLSSSGISLITDGTFVWAGLIDTSYNIQYDKWISGSGWQGWTVLTGPRTNIPGAITGAYSPNPKSIMWIWCEYNTGAETFAIVGSVLSLTSGSPVSNVPFPGIPAAIEQIRPRATIPYELPTRYFALAANYTFTASPGSFAFTGTAATFAIGAIAAEGSFPFTGEAATVNLGFTAGEGSFAFAGESATYIANTIMSASAGSFAFAGEAATFGVSFVAAAGGFAFTGESATLGLGFTAVAGAFAFAGESAAFNLVFFASPGSFAFMGEAASLTITGGTTFNASPGNFAFTGEAAAFALSMAGGSGSFAFGGKPAELGIGINVSPGLFAFDGESATFTVTGLTIFVALANPHAVQLFKSGADSYGAQIVSGGANPHAVQLVSGGADPGAVQDIQ